MSKLYGKILSATEVFLAPLNYKNISNFNLSEELMLQEGFYPVKCFYEKATGIKNWFRESVQIDTTLFTDKICPSPGIYIFNEETQDWELPLDVAKEQKKLELRKDADNEAAVYKVDYSLAEQDTWGRQEAGVHDLLTDPNSKTPNAEWVRMLAQTRGISLDQMIEKITNAVLLANQAAYKVVGKQQKLEDMVTACTSVKEVNAINWELIPTFPH